MTLVGPGTVALVTGSNRGLGLAFVRSLLDRDAGRVYAGVRNRASTDSVPDDPRVVPLIVDLEDAGGIRGLADVARDVTLLVNNAAFAAFAPPLVAPSDDIEREMQVNYLGTYRMIEALAPVLDRNHGAIVTVLSKLALVDAPFAAGYAASKAAAHSMHESLRPVLARRGISLHVAYPGAIDTRMLAQFGGPKTRPLAVADAILDAASAGQTHIFPDPESQAYVRAKQGEAWASR